MRSFRSATVFKLSSTPVFSHTGSKSLSPLSRVQSMQYARPLPGADRRSTLPVSGFFTFMSLKDHFFSSHIMTRWSRTWLSLALHCLISRDVFSVLVLSWKRQCHVRNGDQRWPALRAHVSLEKLETSNLAGTLDTGGTNEKNAKFGQHEREQGHVTYFF